MLYIQSNRKFSCLRRKHAQIRVARLARHTDSFRTTDTHGPQSQQLRSQNLKRKAPKARRLSVIGSAGHDNMYYCILLPALALCSRPCVAPAAATRQFKVRTGRPRYMWSDAVGLGSARPLAIGFAAAAESNAGLLFPTWMIAWGTKCLDDIIHGYYLFIGLMTSLLRRHMEACQQQLT